MTRVTKISIAVFFVLTTLMGSIGLSLHKIACYESGNITIALEKSFCCPSDGQSGLPSSVAAECCDFDHLDFKVSAFRFNDQPSVHIALVPAPFTKVAGVLPALDTPLLYEKLIPPLRNPQRLALLCTYRI